MPNLFLIFPHLKNENVLPLMLLDLLEPGCLSNCLTAAKLRQIRYPELQTEAGNVLPLMLVDLKLTNLTF